MATRRTVAQPGFLLTDSPRRVVVQPTKPPEAVVLPTWGMPRLSLAFIGVALFIVVIHSYRLNIGQLAMVIGFFGVLAQRTKLRFPPGFLWCVLFFCWALFSTSITELPVMTFAATNIYGAPSSPWEPLQELGKVLLISLVVANALRDGSQVSGFFILWLGCFALWPMRGTLLNAMAGIGNFGRYAWNFIFRNPNDLAGIVLLVLGVALAASKAGGYRIRWPARIGTALLVLIVILTQSRGAFLGLMVFGALAITTQRRRVRGLLGAGVLVALVLIAAPDSVWKRIGGMKALTSTDTIAAADGEGSARSRYAIWEVAIRIAKDYPITGVGYGSYPEAHWLYAKSTPGAFSGILSRKDTHSTYLNALAETGIVGFVCLLGFLITFGVFLARSIGRLKHQPGRAEQFKYLLAAWIAFWTAGIFGTYHRIVFPYLFMGFATALAAQYGVLARASAPARAARSGASAPAPALARAAGRP